MSRFVKCGYCHRWECSCYQAVENDGPDAELERAEADTRRLDWRESNHINAEPMAVWSVVKQNWVWQYMGNRYDTLREAIDAAIAQSKEPDDSGRVEDDDIPSETVDAIRRHLDKKNQSKEPA